MNSEEASGACRFAFRTTNLFSESTKYITPSLEIEKVPPSIKNGFVTLKSWARLIKLGPICFAEEFCIFGEGKHPKKKMGRKNIAV